MLSEKEILEIITKGENSFVEFKEAEVRPESIAREIAGFANSQGGVIFLGISHEGKILGIPETSKTEETISNIVRNNINPALNCHYYEVEVNNKFVGVIEVPKGLDKPYQTLDGKFLIRVNSTLRTASQGELLRIFQQAGMFHYDLTGIQNTSPADLNFFKIDKYFEKYGVTISAESDSEKVNILKNADILTSEGNMTIAGALIFGINPERHLHQSGISFARFKGTEIGAELMDKKEINGNLDILIDETSALILNNIAVPSLLKGNKRIETSAVWQPKVFRELLANAVIHRNYSIIGSRVRVFMFDDRIEIISPGRLPNTVTIEKLKVGVSYSINPVIVKFMENLGYIDKLGRGIPMVYRESINLGKKLALKELGEEFKVTLEL